MRENVTLVEAKYFALGSDLDGDGSNIYLSVSVNRNFSSGGEYSAMLMEAAAPDFKKGLEAQIEAVVDWGAKFASELGQTVGEHPETKAFLDAVTAKRELEQLSANKNVNSNQMKCDSEYFQEMYEMNVKKILEVGEKLVSEQRAKHLAES